MDFGSYTRLASANYIGLDLTSVRELKRSQERAKVRSKDSAGSGSVSGDEASPERHALERDGRKLDAAGHTVHQVEDLLADTIIGIRANHEKGLSTIANDRLIKSAKEMAEDIVGYARHDGEPLFPALRAPADSNVQRALGAYGAQKDALKTQRGEKGLPEVRDVIEKTNDKLRGEDGVIPKMGELTEAGASDTDTTAESLDELTKDARTTREEIEQVKRDIVDTRIDAEASKQDDPPSGGIDVAM